MNEELRRELATYRLERAHSSLRTAVILLKEKEYSDCINRTYYACFYAVTALLASIDVLPKSHAGTKTMLHKHFSLTNRITAEHSAFYGQIFNLRQEEDYKDFAIVSPEKASEMLTKAQDFINTLGTLINTELSTNNEQ
jgi:uncharacterized protein (UPF0332 family)